MTKVTFQDQALRFAIERGRITTADVVALFGIPSKAAGAVLFRLREQGFLVLAGPRRGHQIVNRPADIMPISNPVFDTEELTSALGYMPITVRAAARVYEQSWE